MQNRAAFSPRWDLRGLDVTFQENVTFITEKTSAPFRDPDLAKLRSVFAWLTFGSPHKNFDAALLRQRCAQDDTRSGGGDNRLDGRFVNRPYGLILTPSLYPFSKVFEVPRNFFQKVSWWGAGQRPAIVPLLLHLHRADHVKIIFTLGVLGSGDDDTYQRI